MQNRTLVVPQCAGTPGVDYLTVEAETRRWPRIRTLRLVDSATCKTICPHRDRPRQEHVVGDFGTSGLFLDGLPLVVVASLRSWIHEPRP